LDPSIKPNHQERLDPVHKKEDNQYRRQPCDSPIRRPGICLPRFDAAVRNLEKKAALPASEPPAVELNSVLAPAFGAGEKFLFGSDQFDLQTIAFKSESVTSVLSDGREERGQRTTKGKAPSLYRKGRRKTSPTFE